MTENISRSFLLRGRLVFIYPFPFATFCTFFYLLFLVEFDSPLCRSFPPPPFQLTPRRISAGAAFPRFLSVISTRDF